MQTWHRANLRHLRAFAAIVDAGGFARAAERLHLSQPALSRQIHALEAELGVPLFDRLGRRVQLTSEGEDLLRLGRKLLADVESLSERARALRSGRIGILRVGATPQVIENLLAGFLPRYRRSHSGVEVHLIEDGGSRLGDRLAHGDVHLACIPAGDSRFESRLLAPMHLIAAVPRAHRLARRKTVEIADLADEPLLVLQRDFGSRAWFDAACEIARISPRLLLESAVPQTLVALAAKAYGIAIIPSNAGFSRSAIRAVPLVHRGASIGRWQVVAWNPQRFLAPYAMQFIEALIDSAQRAFPGRDAIRRAPALPKPKEMQR